MNSKNIYVKNMKNEEIMNLVFEGFTVYLYLMSFFSL